MYDVHVLCARENSYYHHIASDVWTAKRDAYNFVGSGPIVAHPPCAQWGRLRNLPNINRDDRSKDLGPFCIEAVRKNGGVVEHPAGSQLFKVMDCPRPGALPDKHGGYVMSLKQSDFGHFTKKWTWLYIVRCHPPLLWDQRQLDHVPKFHNLTLRQKEHTPPAFAHFLCQTATTPSY